MASFQTKIGWKGLRERENKNYHSVTQVGKGREREKIKIIVPFRSFPTRNRKLQQNSTKIRKIKEIPLWLQFKPKQDGKCRGREEIKIIVSQIGRASCRERVWR